MGAYSLLAAQRALDDAGISAEDVDGIVVTPSGTGDSWGSRPLPEDFLKAFKQVPGASTADFFTMPFGARYAPTAGAHIEDGLTRMSAEWMVENLPGLTNIKVAYHTGLCVSNALALAAQTVGSGESNVCLVVRVLNNLPGRYYQEPKTKAALNEQWTNPWGFSAAGITDAYAFGQYCRKYGTSHDRMAPFIVNQRRNGRMFPEGYYYQHPEPPLTEEDYLSSRWLAKPMCLHDADRPIQIAVCYIITTADRAKDMRQDPVYILNHITHGGRARSLLMTLDEVEENTDLIARKTYEGAGLNPEDIDIFNPYDGFTLFTQYYLEAFQWHGVKRGEAHDFYAGDISVEGPHPFSSSGGNNGNGRTRTWMHTDSIQQLRGQAGERQVHIKNGRPETAISGGPVPGMGDWIVWSTNPD